MPASPSIRRNTPGATRSTEASAPSKSLPSRSRRGVESPRSMSRPASGRRGLWRRPALWIAAAAAAILFVGWLDTRTAQDVDLSLFYAAAVAGAGWWLGRRYGIAAAALAAGLWTY